MIRSLLTATLLGLLTISAASAQSARAIQADVPFDFTLSGKAMNAGSYRFAYNPTSGILTVNGVGKRSSDTFVMVRTAGVPSAKDAGKLLFDCYAGGCALATVLPGAWSGGPILRLSQAGHRQEIAMGRRVVLIAQK